MAEQSIAKKIVKGMVVVTFFWVFWKFGGLLLSVLIGNLYPPTVPAADAYAQVYKYIVFTFIYSSALKVLLPAFMPIFIERMQKEGEEKAWRFAYSIFNITLVGAIVLAIVGIFTARQLIELLVPGFRTEAKILATDFLRIMLPGTVGMLMSMVMMSVMNSYKIFGYPAAGDAAQKLVWAIALFLGAKVLHLDAHIVAYGLLAGCIVQFLVAGFGLRHKRALYRPLISEPGPRRLFIEITILAAFLAALFTIVIIAQNVVWHPDDAQNSKWTSFIAITGALVIACGYSVCIWLRSRHKTSGIARFAALAGPLMIGVAFARYRDAATAFFQSYTNPGVFADVEFSKTIGNSPIMIVPYALSVAMLPYLCELASSKDMKTFASLVTRTLRMLALFFAPLSIAMMILSGPIIALVYDRGGWTAEHIAYTATALILYVTALFFYAIENVIMQSFFSVQRMWMPTLLGVVASVLQVFFLFAGIQLLGFDHPYDIFIAVAVAYPLSRIFKNIALILVLRLHVPILPLADTAKFIGKLALACAVFAGVVTGSFRAIQQAFPLEKYKKADVVLDTFNAENKNWTSRDADELSVVDDPSEGALIIKYRPVRSREITINRELLQFRLDGATHVEFRCKASSVQEVIVRVASKSTEGEAPVTVTTQWQRHSHPLAPMKDRMRRLTFAIPKGTGDPAELFIDDVRFKSGDRVIAVIDHYGQPSSEWSSESRPVRVAAVGESGPKEKALLLADDAGCNPVARNLLGHDLSGTAQISFKAKATAPGKILVEFRDTSGQRFEESVRLDRTQQRQNCTIAFDRFSGKINPTLLDSVRFDFEPAGGAQSPCTVWLDNITFSIPKSVFGLNLKYEIVKIVSVALPCTLGAIIMIVLIFVMRIEEGRLVLDWLLEQGRGRLRRKARTAPAK